MKHSLLLLGVIAALAIGAPAYSQYIFMDLNNTGTCTSADALTSSVTAVDVWLDTNHNASGTPSTCVNPAQPLSIFSYAVLIHASGGGSGTVVFNGWTNAMTGFAETSPFRVAGSDMGTGWLQQPPGSVTPAGKYKLGTLSLTVTGTPSLSFLSLAPDPVLVDFTGFGSQCDGTVFGNSEVLGFDFTDNCGTAAPTGSTTTTWGKIKKLYQ